LDKAPEMPAAIVPSPLTVMATLSPVTPVLSSVI
jgi:hypothetical protein